MRSLLRGAAVLVLVSARATAQLPNTSFEAGVLAPWYSPSSTWFVTSADAADGTYSAETRGVEELRFDFVTPVPSNDVSVISFWSRYPDPELVYGFLNIAVYYADGTEGGKHWSPTSTDWTHYTANDFVQANQMVVGFGIRGAGSSKVTRLDAIEISAAPEPASLWLLGSGLLVLVAVRRRHHGHEMSSSVIEPAPPVPFSS